MKFVATIVVSMLVLISASVFAHHGAVTSGFLYKADELVEIQGELTEVLWRNPHLRARVRVTDAQGDETIWELELGPTPREFENMGILPDDLLGTVRAAGHVSKRDPHSLGVIYFLLPGGQEHVQGRNREMRWSNVQLFDVTPEIDAAKAEADRQSAEGIYRMWGRRLGRPLDNEITSQALTKQGEQLAAAFDPLTDNAQLDCRHGMPDTMFDPVPMEISKEGDHIRLHIAQYNIQRVIHMEAEPQHDERKKSPVGYSTGRWEGDELIVTTTDVDWPYYLNSGTPQSDQVEYTETFSMSDDGQTLSYSISINDPIVFAQPFTIERTREWTPGVEIEPFDCAADWQDPMAVRIADQQKAADRHEFDFPRDAARKPYQLFRFLGLEEGMVALDVGAYAGYTTEMLAAAVGAEGKVYAHNTEKVLKTYAEGYYERTMTERLANDRLPNVVSYLREYDDLGLEGQVDFAFLGNMLHDFYYRDGEENAIAFLQSIRRALKPGGVFGVMDHVGIAANDNQKLHRMTPQLARELLVKSGFVVEAESDMYANADDDHSLMVYNDAIYLKTDRFLLRARKPGD